MPDEIEDERRRRLAAVIDAGEDPEENIAPIRSATPNLSDRGRMGAGLSFPVLDVSPGDAEFLRAAAGRGAPQDERPLAPPGEAPKQWKGGVTEADFGRPRQLADLISMATMIRDRAQSGRPMSAEEIVEAKRQQGRERAVKDFENLRANLYAVDPQMRIAAEREWDRYRQFPGLAESEFGPGAGRFKPQGQVDLEIDRARDDKRFEREMAIKDRSVDVPVRVAEVQGGSEAATAEIQRQIAAGRDASAQKIEEMRARGQRHDIDARRATEAEKASAATRVAEIQADSPEAQDRREAAKLKKTLLEAQARAMTQKVEPRGLAAEATLKMNDVFGKSDTGHAEVLLNALESYARSTGSAQGSAVLKDAIAQGESGLHKLAVALGGELEKTGLGLSPEEAQEWARASLMMHARRVR